MFGFTRKPRTEPAPVDRAALAAALRAFADDLEVDDSYAVDCTTPRGEMPLGVEGWLQHAGHRDTFRALVARDNA